MANDLVVTEVVRKRYLVCFKREKFNDLLDKMWSGGESCECLPTPDEHGGWLPNDDTMRFVTSKYMEVEVSRYETYRGGELIAINGEPI